MNYSKVRFNCEYYYTFYFKAVPLLIRFALLGACDFSLGEPTPSSVTGGTERGRHSQQQPHGGPPYYRPQSFNQAFLGYPRNGAMPYGTPGAGPYGQPPMVPGREPWRIDRRTQETAPQRGPSAEGPYREEGMRTIHVYVWYYTCTCML